MFDNRYRGDLRPPRTMHQVYEARARQRRLWVAALIASGSAIAMFVAGLI